MPNISWSPGIRPNLQRAGGAASQLLAASTDLERLAGVMADQAREFLDQVRVG